MFVLGSNALLVISVFIGACLPALLHWAASIEVGYAVSRVKGFIIDNGLMDIIGIQFCRV